MLPRAACTVAVALSAALAAEWSGRTPEVDDIVKQAFLREQANEAEARRYTFHFREERRNLDRGGGIESAESKTFDVTFLFGKEHKRLIAVNDRPLAPQRDAKERREIEQRIAKIERLTPAQRRKQAERIDRERKEERARTVELRNVFTFSLVGEEIIDGMETWVIRAEPRPGYRPRQPRSKFLQKMRGAFWIAKEDYGWVKIEGETLDTVSFGMFLFRLAKGSTFSLRRRKLEEGAWVKDNFRLRADVRAGLLITLRREILGSYRNYRKFSAEPKPTAAGSSQAGGRRPALPL